MKASAILNDKALTEQNYFEDKSYVSNSMLGLLKKSPLHLQHYIDGSLKKESPALRFGSAYDMLVFEPELFAKCFTYIPKGIRRNTIKHREWQEKYNPNFCTELTKTEWDECFYMLEAIKKHPEIWEMLSIGQSQKILTWTFDNVFCKGKLDNYIEGHAIIDLKTTKDAGYHGFSRAISYNYDYDRQAAWYVDGEGNNLEFWWIAQEKEFPYIPALYKASDDTIDRGREKYTKLFYQYKKYFIEEEFNKDEFIIQAEI